MVVARTDRGRGAVSPPPYAVGSSETSDTAATPCACEARCSAAGSGSDEVYVIARPEHPHDPNVAVGREGTRAGLRGVVEDGVVTVANDCAPPGAFLRARTESTGSFAHLPPAPPPARACASVAGAWAVIARPARAHAPDRCEHGVCAAGLLRRACGGVTRQSRGSGRAPKAGGVRCPGPPLCDAGDTRGTPPLPLAGVRRLWCFPCAPCFHKFSSALGGNCRT